MLYRASRRLQQALRGPPLSSFASFAASSSLPSPPGFHFDFRHRSLLIVLFGVVSVFLIVFVFFFFLFHFLFHTLIHFVFLLSYFRPCFFIFFNLCSSCPFSSLPCSFSSCSYFYYCCCSVFFFFFNFKLHILYIFLFLFYIYICSC